MITRTATECQIPDWRREMARSVTSPDELLQLLGLPDTLLPAARAAAARFGLRVPRGYLALMKRGDPGDPLLRQVMPVAEELDEVAGFSDDPVGDLAAQRGAGVLTKYHGRALLITTGACAVNCRYCFRRAFPYAEQSALRDHWRGALSRIRDNPDISEVILSGGDPLSLDDARLAELLRGLEQIPHVRRLRIHTRLPVVLPQRVTDKLVSLLAQTRLRCVTVLHFNHPRELAGTASEALERLALTGTLLNQSVMLRGVNDQLDALTELSERLFDTGVLPYYIHLLDRVSGAAHFEVDESRARGLIDDMRNRLPGYLVPRLVREKRGEPAKVPVA